MSGVRWAAAAMAGALIVLAAYLYYDDFAAENGARYTEFYVLAPDGSTAIDTSVVAGSSLPLLVGIVTSVTLSQRAGMAVLVVFFSVGALLLMRVRA